MKLINLPQAVRILNAGGIIIYPTDTAFGIGCRIDKYQTVDKLFKIRKRPPEVAMPVLVGSVEMANKYFDKPDDVVVKMMKKYWPGALTIVYNCKEKSIYPPIRASKKTVGLRLPDNATVIELIRSVEVPILGPSANFHGGITPFKIEEVDPELISKVDGVVGGVCTLKRVSTVVDLSVKPYRIIRPGAIKIK
jgi:L-threonylcarbamoyladenylate synthase